MVLILWGIFEMPLTSQTIEFEGYFADGVLGIFKIIRSFADLRDLAAILVPYELNEGTEAKPTFHLAENLVFKWTQWLSRLYTRDLRAAA